MEFSKEFIEEQKFTPDQVTAITSNVTTHYDDKIAVLKGEWDGLANKNAERILDGVIGSTQSKTGFKLERNQGEKHAEYLLRFNDAYLSDQKTSLENAKIELDKKIKEGGTDPVVVVYNFAVFSFGHPFNSFLSLINIKVYGRVFFF